MPPSCRPTRRRAASARSRARATGGASGSGCAHDKVTLAVIGVLVVLLIMVVFAPWFTVHDPYAGSVLRRLKPVGTPGHWLGTDEVGRDLWSRMVYGGRLSLLAGVVPVFLALLIGGFLGVLAGYAGGLVNSAIMRLTDVLYAFPSILLAIAITGILGSGLQNTILALTDQLHPAGHAHLGERHHAGAASRLRRGGAGERRAAR